MSTQNRKKYTIRYKNVSPAYLQDIREIFTQRPYLSPRLYPNESRYTNIRRLRDERTKYVYDENWIQKFIDESIFHNPQRRVTPPFFVVYLLFCKKEGGFRHVKKNI